MSFINSLLKIGWWTPKLVCNTHNPTGLKLLTGLRLELSHLNEHKFNHSFRDCTSFMPLKVVSATFLLVCF